MSASVTTKLERTVRQTHGLEGSALRTTRERTTGTTATARRKAESSTRIGSRAVASLANVPNSVFAAVRERELLTICWLLLLLPLFLLSTSWLTCQVAPLRDAHRQLAAICIKGPCDRLAAESRRDPPRNTSELPDLWSGRHLESARVLPAVGWENFSPSPGHHHEASLLHLPGTATPKEPTTLASISTSRAHAAPSAHADSYLICSLYSGFAPLRPHCCRNKPHDTSCTRPSERMRLTASTSLPISLPATRLPASDWHHGLALPQFILQLWRWTAAVSAIPVWRTAVVLRLSAQPPQPVRSATATAIARTTESTAPNTAPTAPTTHTGLLVTALRALQQLQDLPGALSKCCRKSIEQWLLECQSIWWLLRKLLARCIDSTAASGLHTARLQRASLHGLIGLQSDTASTALDPAIWPALFWCVRSAKPCRRRTRTKRYSTQRRWTTSGGCARWHRRC